jgi:hypothetical protein
LGSTSTSASRRSRGIEAIDTPRDGLYRGASGRPSAFLSRRACVGKVCASWQSPRLLPCFGGCNFLIGSRKENTSQPTSDWPSVDGKFLKSTGLSRLFAREFIVYAPFCQLPQLSAAPRHYRGTIVVQHTSPALQDINDMGVTTSTGCRGT